MHQHTSTLNTQRRTSVQYCPLVSGIFCYGVFNFSLENFVNGLTLYVPNRKVLKS